ncbi:GntR family transcriptional regulator [Streptacidiphilus melanogenes]|uniref:GntR family transcriptional regulator n=1 Tax=Streptacidiphilus melanogenes TaxID=411235 RepID=UPI0005AADB57|nr:GntR family transcriptional regulator [Streptacidiphilus melanogenes]
MTVPPADERPPYLRAADELRADIARGRYKVGDQLPGAPELEKRFGVAPMTLRNAMRVLREEGLIYAVQGRGTFVRQTPKQAQGAGPEAGGEMVQVPAADLERLMTLLESQQEQIQQALQRIDALEERQSGKPRR